MKIHKENKLTTKRTAFVILALAMLLSACSTSATENTTEEERYVPVTVTAVEQGNLTETTRISAKLEPVEEASLAPTGGGKVKEIYADIGDQVEAGQPLLKLDEENLQSQLNQARAGFNVAETGYRQAVEAAKQRVIQAQSNYINAKQALDDAERNFERMNTLYEAEAISRQQWEQAKTQYVQTQSQFAMSKQEYELVIGTTPPAVTEGETAEPGQKTLNVDQLAQSQESVASARAQMEQARASLQAAQTQFNQSVLESPITGVIASRQINAGEMASAQMPVFRVVNLDKMVVNLNVPENLIGNIANGDEIELYIPTLQKTVKGVVTAVSPAADPNTMAFPVKIEVDNPNHELKGGIIVQVPLVKQTSEQTLIIPTAALLESNGLYRVFVIREDDQRDENTYSVEERIVQRGLVTSDRVEILDGLKAGERVVVKGKNILSDGGLVKIITESAAEMREGDHQ